MGLGVLEFRVEGLGFGGLGFRSFGGLGVWGSGFRVWAAREASLESRIFGVPEP